MPSIMVAGSAFGYTKLQVGLARRLGRAIADAGCTLVNGAATGLPYVAAEAARSVGGQIIAVSPASSLEEHLYYFGFPDYPGEVILFAGNWANQTWYHCVYHRLTDRQFEKIRDLKKQFMLKFRNTISVAISSAVIAIGGRIGTINELTIASDFAKPIGIVKGGGGTSEHFPEIACQSGKQKAPILILPPTVLVGQILKTLGGV